jgi:acetyl-CoA carboxylase biotin carboxyl carrier protein
MRIETNYIEKLAKIINDNGLTEISLEDGEQAITIRKDAPEVVNVAATAVHAVTTATSNIQETPSTEESVKSAQKGKAITSPMVGTFYASSSPESEPFVEVGSEINEGDVVCIIEAMKLMNEIKSEHSGKVTQICVKNGDPIEYGQILMYVE